MRTSVTVRANRLAVGLLAVSLGAAFSACERSPEGRADPSDAEIARLRGLPYAGGSRAAGESGVVMHDAARSSPGVNLYTIPDLRRVELIDADGTVIRSWSVPDAKRLVHAELLADGRLVVLGADNGDLPPESPPQAIGDSARFMMCFNWEGEALWKREVIAHHDVTATADGGLLALTFSRRIVPRISESIPVRDDELSWYTGDGKPIRSLSLFDASMRGGRAFTLHGVRPSSLGGPPWFDCFHANSVDIISQSEPAHRHPIYEPGNVLVCLRHQDSILVVNPRERRVVWSWGRGVLAGPHDAQMLDDGHILLFDNGLGRGYSRAVELDPVSEEIVWEYAGDPKDSFYTASKGSVQRLPNGNTLMAESDSGRAIEVTADGEIVWEYRCPHELSPGVRAAIARIKRFPVSIIEEHSDDGPSR